MSPVTAIIPTHNRLALLRESLASVLGQTRPPAQVIVVDDGSTDGTADRIAAEYPGITVVRQAHGGKSAALNRGLRLATQDHVWIMDDDDIACPDGLARLVSALDREPGAGFAYGSYERFGALGPGDDHGPGHWRSCAPDQFLVCTLEDMFVHQGAMLVRRNLYQRAGPFRESLPRSIDYEMLLRLARLARPVVVDGPIFRYRLHDGPRGPGGRPLSFRQRQELWVTCDREIFTRVHADWPLSCFLPGQVGPREPRELRVALLQRGTTMARHKLWPLALDDFRAAARLSDAPLSMAEAGIVRRAMASKFGCRDVLDDDRLLMAIHDLSGLGRIGAGLSRTLARGLLWRGREGLAQGDLAQAWQVGRAIATVLGGRAAASLIPVAPPRGRPA